MYLLSVFPLPDEEVRVTAICVVEPEGSAYSPIVVGRDQFVEALASLNLWKEQRLLEIRVDEDQPLQFSLAEEKASDLFFCLHFGEDGHPGASTTVDTRYVMQ